MVPNCSPGQYASIYTQRNSFRSNFKVDLSRPLCIMLFAMTFGDFNIHLNQTIVFTKVVVLLTNYQAPLTVFCCDSWFSRSNGSPTLRTHPILSLSEPTQKSVRRIASGFDGRRSTVYNQRCFVSQYSARYRYQASACSQVLRLAGLPSDSDWRTIVLNRSRLARVRTSIMRMFNIGILLSRFNFRLQLR